MVLQRPVFPKLSKVQGHKRELGRTTRPHPPSNHLLHVCALALRCSTRRVVRCTAHLIPTDPSSVHRPVFVCARSTGVYGPNVRSRTCVETGSHSMLTLAMRSGAFLHLVVTLTALVARLAHLSSALRSVLSVLHAESIRLLDTLHVRTESSIRRRSGLTTILFFPARSHARRTTPAAASPPRWGRRRSVKHCARLHGAHGSR